jgi:hypothetical protein
MTHPTVVHPNGMVRVNGEHVPISYHPLVSPSVRQALPQLMKDHE